MAETTLSRSGSRRAGLHAEAVESGRRHDTGDAFTDRFLDQLPSDLAASFSREQLNAVRMVFGARLPTRHQVEHRHLLRLGGKSYYLVFLMGRASPKAEARLELATNPARRWAYRTLVGIAFATVGYLAALGGGLPGLG